MRVFTAEPFFDPGNEGLRHLPEGPRQLRDGRLGWVAIEHGPHSHHGSLNILDLATRVNETHVVEGLPGFFAETTDPGVFLIGLDRELVLYSLGQRKLTRTGHVCSPNPGVTINDGMAIEGGLLFGTKHLTFRERVAASYWYHSATRETKEIRHGEICANGKFLFNGNQLVDIDSFDRTVELLEVDWQNATTKKVRTIADYRETNLFPDGLRPTPDGRSVIVAFYNPDPAEYGVARQFSIADGSVEAEWRFPGSPRVTCPEWVRVNGEVKLLFTTAVEGMPEERRADAPHAGWLFLAEALTPAMAIGCAVILLGTALATGVLAPRWLTPAAKAR